MSEDSGRSERSTATGSLSRRRLLALAGTGVATSVAGCDGSGGGGETPTETATATPTEEPTDTPTETATPSPTPAPVSGGSQFDPDVGFASTEWLEEEDVTVHRVQEATAEAFNEAVNAGGPRVVVFETSGTIDLQDQRFTIQSDKLWLAGQTAPSPGITLVKGDLWIDADDCVIQHLRVRPGDAGKDPSAEWEPDTIRTADGSQNVIIDHCSATWSVDENISPGYDSVDTTITNSIVAEALNDSTHHKGPHPYGMLVGDGSTNVTIAGNVFAHNISRNPRLKAETTSAVVNNVMYNFDEAVNLDDSTEAAIVGNAFLRVDEGDPVIEGGKVYHEDNITEPETPLTTEIEDYAGPPLWPGDLEAMPASDVEEHNLNYAGARPADRTEHDQRIVDHVRNNEGDLIDSQEDVGGYPDLAENTHELDVPDSGLRNWLAQWAVAVEESDVNPPQ